MNRDKRGTDAAARLLARATSDPGLRQQLELAYRGSGDVLDALWWCAHPGSTAPSGRPDPAAAIAVLAQRAFDRNASAADLASFRDAESRRAEDAAALDGLLERAEPESTVDGPDALGSSVASAATHADVPDDPDGHRADAPPRVRRARLPATVALVLIGGLALGCVFLAVQLAASEERFEPVVPAGGLDPLARFEVEQSAADIPAVTLPRDYDETTVRRLVRDQPGLITDFVLFGSRTIDEQVCLLLVFPDGEIASSCVSLPEFRRNGLEVSSNLLRGTPSSENAPVPVTQTVTWRPDDSLLFSSVLAEAP